MRDLHKVLTLFATDHDMDYCEDFDEIKKFLEHCNRNVKSFSKLESYRGYEPYVNEICSGLKQIIISKNYVDENTMEPLESAFANLRKITMFLFLNTDTDYKYNLNRDPSIQHLLGVCPLLSKFLLLYLVWSLKLDKFFYEALAYTPVWFGFQYFQPASDSMVYIKDPYDVLEKVDQLVTAVYLSISRSDSREMEIAERKIIYSKLYDYTTTFLRNFYMADAEKFEKFTKRQFQKFLGYTLKHLLEMILRFFDVYEQPAKLLPKVSLYEICQHFSKQLPERKQASALTMEQQINIIKVVLDSLQYNLQQVKVNIFIYWVEVDINERQNLQMVIGELAYKVRERILANNCFEHKVATHLNSIVIIPKTMEEIVREATLGEVLGNLDKELPLHIKKVYFDEIFNRNVALGNDECLESIKKNIKLMTVKNCKQIIDYIHLDIMHNHAMENEDIKSSIKMQEITTATLQDEVVQMYIDRKDYEFLITIILSSLINYEPKDLLQLISYVLQIFGETTTICWTSTVDFHQRATEFLNKYSSADFDFKGFLQLCFENTKLMWSKFFEAACHNNEHITAFCVTVRDTRPFSNTYFTALLNTAMNDLTYLQQKYFPTLLCEIYFTLYYPERKTEFLKQIINKSIIEMLDSQNFTGILPIVKAINLIAIHGETQSHKPLNFDEITAPVLLMVAQIMEKTRWDLITYTDERDEIVRDCIRFIQGTSKKFLPVATEKDRKWISKVMQDSYRPLTQYYFQKFSQSSEQPPVDFDRFLIPLEIEDKSEAEMFLIINYVRCTMKEAEWLARSQRLSPHISDMMLILGGVVTETANSNAINNYRHCMVNYGHIVTMFILPKVENNKNVEKLMLKVLKIIESSPVEIYEEMFMSFEWLLFAILNKCSEPLEDSRVKHIERCVISLPDCNAKSIFARKFQIFTTGEKLSSNNKDLIENQQK